jgi:hypothetical protein
VDGVGYAHPANIVREDKSYGMCDL